MPRKRTGGRWSMEEAPLHFIASQPEVLRLQTGADLLMAVNELGSAEAVGYLDDQLARGGRVLLDSGVYNLAMAHAKQHGLTMDEALAVPVTDLDGFAALYERYVGLVMQFGGAVWGYIELDLGGVTGKRATRAKLEAVGLAPIPVYHPLNDGWDYFDELASQYDRVCVGNVVHAPAPTRLRILATLWERRQAYSHLWVHVLGFNLHEWCLAYPMQSCDSSSWLSGIRWQQGYMERAALEYLGELPRRFRFQLGDEVTYGQSVQMASFGAQLNARNWANHLAALGVRRA